MVEPVGFIEAWKAQFPESEPPRMELHSVGGIEQELERCKATIRRLEQEVNQERFRMIYLQTLLAKERKSYDKQRWGFRRTPLNEGVDPEPPGADGPPGHPHHNQQQQQQQQPHVQETGAPGPVARFQPPGDGTGPRTRPRPPPAGARKSASHGDGLEAATLEVGQQTDDHPDGPSPSKQRGGGGSSASPRRPHPLDREMTSDPKLGMGLGVAALRSNFERIKRANSQTSGVGAGEKLAPPPPPPPFYPNLEFHQDRSLARDGPDRTVLQMERKRSLHSLPGNLATAAGELRARPVYRGRSSETTCGYDAESEDGEPAALPPQLRSSARPPPAWQPSPDFQGYSSVYVGGVMMGEGGLGPDEHLLACWPRRSYSPGSLEDMGIGGVASGVGGGYTPDCSSNENLTSSEDDFSSGPSPGHVSPSPTAAFRRPFHREKSRSPSQNSHNSQQSLDNGSSPPTPPPAQQQAAQRRLPHTSEAAIVSVRKTGQIWPPPSAVAKGSHDCGLAGEHWTDGHYPGTPPPPAYSYDADRAEEQRRHHDILPYIDDSPSSSPHLSSKSRSSRDTLSSGSLESAKSTECDLEKGLEMRKWVLSAILASEETYLSHLEALLLPMKPLRAAATTSQPVLSLAQIDTIFFKVPELYEVHREFYDGLLPRVQQWSLQQRVGELFHRLASQLGVYRAFVDNYEVAVETAERCCQVNSQFAEISENLKVRSPKESKEPAAKNSLEALLYKPVDRVTRSTLVLHDLLKHTPPGHPDHLLLQDALRISQNFLSSINQEGAPRRQSRQLLRDILMVELVEGNRKLRHIFLFSDILLCTKLKKHMGGKSQQYDCKWYVPLSELCLQAAEEAEPLTVPQVTDEELDAVKVKISHLRSEIQKEKRGNKSCKATERLRKKLQEQQSLLLLMSPSIPLRLHSKSSGKTYNFLISSDYERADWKEAIREQQKKCLRMASLTSVELQLLTSSCMKLQTVQQAMLNPGQIDDEPSGLHGFLNVIVHSASGLKQSLNLYCTLEVDSFGFFCSKAKTRVYRYTTEPKWNEEFEIELEGSQTLRLLCYEKCYNRSQQARDEADSSDRIIGKGHIPLEPQSLQGSDWQRTVIPMNGIEVKISIKFSSREFSLKRVPCRKPMGVFGVKISTVTKRERSKVPYIVRQCLEEIERRGLEEVGIYRVSGVATDIQALKTAFDSNHQDVSVMMSEMDVNAIAGTLKLYFRELPEPLFTDELYPNFTGGITLSDSVAKESCMLNLLLSLPEPNLVTFLFLLDHLKRVAEKENVNKMSLHNLATVFGPTLLRPSETKTSSQPISIGDSWSLEVMAQVQVLLYFLQLETIPTPDSKRQSILFSTEV